MVLTRSNSQSRLSRSTQPGSAKLVLSPRQCMESRQLMSDWGSHRNVDLMRVCFTRLIKHYLINCVVTLQLACHVSISFISFKNTIMQAIATRGMCTLWRCRSTPSLPGITCTFRVTCSAWGSDMKYIYNGRTDSRIFRLKCSWCSSRHAT